ncbi:acetyl-CoA C-acyltransferase, partial [Pseudomonas sp. CM27]|uniref:thiolase family protein n=2 Tax=unclassified Pseudomonas TaxID=196821 RepID=UPI0015567F1B
MDMNEAVIVATARTALAKSFRGSFNDTEAPVLGGHVVRAVVERAGVEAEAIDDVIMGAAVQQGTQAYNIGRLCAYTGGLPASVAGMAVDRMCASGLISIGLAAKGIVTGELGIAIAGGVESLSLTQTRHKNTYRAQSQAVLEVMPDAYIPMLETAEIVSRRYGISRAAQDEYALQSQLRTAAAQRSGLFDEELVALEVDKLLFDKEGQPAGHERVRVERDECNRPGTRLEDLAALKPVWKDGKWVGAGEFVTAGNASQFSDGASASLL